jgi:hypothetical protein
VHYSKKVENRLKLFSIVSVNVWVLMKELLRYYNTLDKRVRAHALGYCPHVCVCVSIYIYIYI